MNEEKAPRYPLFPLSSRILFTRFQEKVGSTNMAKRMGPSESDSNTY